MTDFAVQQHLALGDGAPSGLYWRGDAAPDGHGGLAVPEGGRLDLGTWFNAAPVGWWRRVLGIESVRLAVTGTGPAEIAVYRAAHGTGPQQVAGGCLDGRFAVDVPVGDAHWLWVVLSAGHAPAALDSLTWSAHAGHAAPAAHAGHAAPAMHTVQADSSSPDGAAGSDREPASVRSGPGLRATVVVPTYGREQDALDQVARLLDPARADVVARVVLIDQAGTVREAPGASEAIASAGERLLLVEQDNLGGSGGYARGMLESLRHPGDAVLLLDDDARIEPAGLRRMLAMVAAARAQGHHLILGTPLLSAERPGNLEALAEGVRRRDFRWGPSDRIGDGVDVSVTGPQDWTFADPAAPVDYSGWWATLLPPGAVAELGLPAPYFLKWDDAEYGLRARRAGYLIATVPGTGAWHPTWAAKGTISSWAAWPLHRNRLATAAAYGAGRGVLADSLVHQLKHVLSLQYRTVELWDAALAQFLAGPEWLDGSLRSTRSRAQALLDEAAARAESVTDRAVTAGAVTRHDGPATDEKPPGTAVLALRMARGVSGLLTRNRRRQVVRCAPAEFTWRTGLGRDAVLLDGSEQALRRDPAMARALVWRTLRLHLRTAIRWGSLRRRYAAALPASRSEQRWRATLGC